MNATPVARKAPSIAVVDGTLTTTSLAIAEFFSKRHDDVLKKIRALEPDMPKEYHARNFAAMVITVDIGSGATRNDPAYRITRDGFTLLTGAPPARQPVRFRPPQLTLGGGSYNELEHIS